MTRYWDYLMRRKGLLFPIAMLFLLSGLFSYGFLRRYQVQPSVPEVPLAHIYVDLASDSDSTPGTAGIEPTLAHSIPTVIMSPSEITATFATTIEPPITEAPVTENPPIVDAPASEAPLIEVPATAEPAPEDIKNLPTNHFLPTFVLLFCFSLVGSFWLYFIYEHYTR